MTNKKLPHREKIFYKMPYYVFFAGLASLLILSGIAFFYSAIKNREIFINPEFQTIDTTKKQVVNVSVVSTAPPETNQWNIYNFERYGFSFRYPKEATVINNESDRGVYIISKTTSLEDLSKQDIDPMNVRIFVYIDTTIENETVITRTRMDSSVIQNMIINGLHAIKITGTETLYDKNTHTLTTSSGLKVYYITGKPIDGRSVVISIAPRFAGKVVTEETRRENAALAEKIAKTVILSPQP